jgi:hypothetical protein
VWRLRDYHPHMRWQLWLIPVILLAACAPPSSGPVSLSGSVTGLDSGASAYLRLEQLRGDQVPGQGQTISRFRVTDGSWEQTGLALEPGGYGLVPEAEGYVSRLGTLTFQILSADGTWDYRHLDFELFRPEQATEYVGVPLCSEPPAGGGSYVYVGPEDPPTPTPTFVPVGAAVTESAPLWPPGTCYAGQYQHIQYWSLGIQGVVSGLPPGQAAEILVYVLPPVMGEAYSYGGAPPPDTAVGIIQTL